MLQDARSEPENTAREPCIHVRCGSSFEVNLACMFRGVACIGMRSEGALMSFDTLRIQGLIIRY